MKRSIGISALAITFTACSVFTVGERKPAAFYTVPTEMLGRNFVDEHGGEYTLGLKKIATFIKWTRGNPIPMFQTLRKEAPLLETGQIPGVRKYLTEEEKLNTPSTLVVSLDEDVRDILNHPEIFSVKLYQAKMDQSVGEYMLGNDNKKVNQEKPWMRSMLKPEDLPKVKAMVRELTLKAISESNVNGRIEVVNAIARRVPIELSGKYFGFPGPSLRSMYKWSRDTQYSFFHNAKNEEVYEQNAITSGHEMHSYLEAFLKEKRQSKSYLKEDTVLARMMKSNVPDSEMLNFYDGRNRTNIIGTLVGGVETTQAAITQALEFFLENPEIMQGAQEAALADNDALLEKYVWEALRFRPVNPFVIRYAEKDYILGEGTSREYRVKKGQVVLVGTMSAMFDESVVHNPKEFRLDRPDVNAKNTIYYHFGFGNHKCLGDYVAQVEVPEVIKHILRLPGVRASTGARMGIGHHDNIGAIEIVEDKEKSPFPESFIIEFNKSTPKDQLTVADPRFIFEDYLMDYDRNYFRSCLSGFKSTSVLKNMLQPIISNIKVRGKYSDAHDLFVCRLPAKFNNCVGGLAKGDYVGSYEKCKNELSELEQYFYQSEVLGKPLDLEKIPKKDKEIINSGFEFENELKFYDRADYRQTFMNPVSAKSFPVSINESTKQILFYARVPLDFRKCIAPKVLIKKMTRSEAFSTCMKDSEITLDDKTAKYYREIVLKGELE